MARRAQRHGSILHVEHRIVSGRPSSHRACYSIPLWRLCASMKYMSTASCLPHGSDELSPAGPRQQAPSAQEATTTNAAARSAVSRCGAAARSAVSRVHATHLCMLHMQGRSARLRVEIACGMCSSADCAPYEHGSIRCRLHPHDICCRPLAVSLWQARSCARANCLRCVRAPYALRMNTERLVPFAL